MSYSNATEEVKRSDSSSKYTIMTQKTNRTLNSVKDSLVKQRNHYKKGSKEGTENPFVKKTIHIYDKENYDENSKEEYNNPSNHENSAKAKNENKQNLFPNNVIQDSIQKSLESSYKQNKMMFSSMRFCDLIKVNPTPAENLPKVWTKQEEGGDEIKLDQLRLFESIDENSGGESDNEIVQRPIKLFDDSD